MRRKRRSSAAGIANVGIGGVIFIGAIICQPSAYQRIGVSWRLIRRGGNRLASEAGGVARKAGISWPWRLMAARKSARKRISSARLAVASSWRQWRFGVAWHRRHLASVARHGSAASRGARWRGCLAAAVAACGVGLAKAWRINGVAGENVAAGMAQLSMAKCGWLRLALHRQWRKRMWLAAVSSARRGARISNRNRRNSAAAAA